MKLELNGHVEADVGQELCTYRTAAKEDIVAAQSSRYFRKFVPQLFGPTHNLYGQNRPQYSILGNLERRTNRACRI